jgi:two-component system response regulator AtoC
MPKTKILVVDDEELIRWSLTENLRAEGHEVLTAETGEEGLEITKAEMPDLIVLDYRLPGMDGLEVLRRIKEINANQLVIMMTAFGAVDKAVIAMRLGAYDYLNKPFNQDELKLSIAKALEATRLRREVAHSLEQQKRRFDLGNIVGVSPKMQQIFETARKIAQSDATTVLIEGESGTGKDLIARAIHYSSKRASEPLMTINCSALPENLLQTELFGHEKGAFTDAKTMRKGLLELADEGTVFLDEIGDMSLSLQAKILHFIEYKTFKRVGGLRDILVNARIVAATNRDLNEAVKGGSFRGDLYYRLKVIPIHMPPLRERKEDILPLAKFFIETFNVEFRKDIKGLAPEAEQLLLSHSWLGNARELKNAIERAIILGSEPIILAEHLAIDVVNPVAEGNRTEFVCELPEEGMAIEEVEGQLISQALQRVDGNQTQAARLLKLSRDALRYRMKKHGLL